ncbi:MAG TPA: ABC-2 transporter permease [Clostridia bacterium]|nr:ABC-2 transporter permease [Clostridia bacterium]
MAKLDFFTMKSQLVGYLTLVLFVFMFGYMGSSITLLGINIAWSIALMSSNIFMVQEKNNLNRLYSSVSIGQKDIVLGRYLFMISSHIASFVLTVIMCSGLILVQNKSLNLADVFLGFSVSFLVFSAITGIQMPLFFRMGYIKARGWFLLIFVVVIALALLPFFIPTLFETVKPILSNRSFLSVFGILVGCILQYVSYRISIIAYRKRV